MFLIFCQACEGEKWAVKRVGPLPGGTAARDRSTDNVWNVCRTCGAHYHALLAVGARRARRAQAAAGQLPLFTAENR